MARKLTGLGLPSERQFLAKAQTVKAPVPLAQAWPGTGAAETLVLVADQFGKVIGELDAALAGAAWKVNDYGQARWERPHALAIAGELAEYGNRVLVQFGNGLPNWGGILDLPHRRQKGSSSLVAYSAEWLAFQRNVGRARYFSNVRVGQIFTALVRENMPGEYEIGEVWDGGEPHGPDYHLRSLGDIFTKSLATAMEAAEWNVQAELWGGRIVFVANLREQRKRLVANAALVEGVNAVNVRLDEQGPIVNEWVMAGEGTGWSETARNFSTQSDRDSIDRYGLRQRGEVQLGVVVADTLERNTATRLAQTKEPRPLVSLEALDLPPARWGQYGVGDSLPVSLAAVQPGGYDGEVRVLAREYVGTRNVCSLVVE